MDRYQNNYDSAAAVADSGDLSRGRTVALSDRSMRRAAHAADASRTAVPLASRRTAAAAGSSADAASRGETPRGAHRYSAAQRAEAAPAREYARAPVKASAKKKKRAAEARRQTNFMKYAADNRFVQALYNFSTGRYKPVFILLVVAVALAGLYGPVRDCYVAYRTGDILARQVELREKYNEGLQSDVNTLLSREGIEDKARKDLGLVMPGETTLTVEGLDDDSGDSSSSSDSSSEDSSSSSDSSDSSDSTTMTAEELEQAENDVINDSPWYIKALDVVFFFTGTSGQTVTSTGASS